MTVNRKIRPLTHRQKEIVDFISQYRVTKGISPSLEEIATALGLNAVSTIHQHIKLIQNKGYLQRDNFQPRGLMPLQQSENLTEIPLMGVIAAGKPIEPIENPEPILIPKSMIKNAANYYALTVKGDSMIEDDVWDGDTILIKHQNTANVGDMVVAVVDGEVTLKRFGGLEKGRIKLIPKNPNLQPFFVEPTGFEIRGKFAGLIRRA